MVDENKAFSGSAALPQEQIVANCCMSDHSYILLDENILFSWKDEFDLMNSCL